MELFLFDNTNLTINRTVWTACFIKNIGRIITYACILGVTCQIINHDDVQCAAVFAQSPEVQDTRAPCSECQFRFRLLLLLLLLLLILVLSHKATGRGRQWRIDTLDCASDVDGLLMTSFAWLTSIPVAWTLQYSVIQKIRTTKLYV